MRVGYDHYVGIYLMLSKIGYDEAVKASATLEEWTVVETIAMIEIEVKKVRLQDYEWECICEDIKDSKIGGWKKEIKDLHKTTIYNMWENME